MTWQEVVILIQLIFLIAAFFCILRYIVRRINAIPIEHKNKCEWCDLEYQAHKKERFCKLHQERVIQMKKAGRYFYREGSRIEWREIGGIYE